MFISENRPSWLSSLATAVFLGFMTLLSGCGGGGASPSNNPPMTIVPGSATVYAYADTPTTLTIRGGVKPFNVYSDNPAIISFNSSTMPDGRVPDEVINLGGPTGQYGRVNNVDAKTTVTLTVRDADGTQVSVPVTVMPSSLNDSLTITGDAVGTSCTGGIGILCSGGQATASVRATTITGGPVIGHKVRFRVMDQGAKYGFVCNQSLGDCLAIETDSLGHIITIETTTDRNGDAFAVVQADSDTTTQYATISATDLATGHALRKQFIIAGRALSVIPTEITLTGADVVAPAPAVCPGAVADFAQIYIFGGIPPYTIVSTGTAYVTVAPASVTASGGYFNLSTPGGCADPVQVIVMDAVGTQITIPVHLVKGASI